MKKQRLNQLSISELASVFRASALQQDHCLLMDDIAGYNKLYRKMEAIKAELSARPTDERRSLLPLIDDDNPQVRLKAAIACAAIAPERSRAALESLSSQTNLPQSLNAGMFLSSLDEGKFVPT